MKTIDEPALDEFCAALAALQNPADIRTVLQEILTPGERHDIALRWRLLQMLKAGIPQRAIAKALGVSLCKITRGSRELRKRKSVIREILPPFKQD